MLILTNGLADVVDEGFLKVANSLVKRLKTLESERVYIVTYERKTDISDKHLQLNKLLLNGELISEICSRREEVLYIPFPAKSFATALRVFILSIFSKYGLSVVWVQKAPLDTAARLLLKLSRAKITVFSKESFDYFSSILGVKRVKYIKTGVDTDKFKPVSDDVSTRLKEKYGLDPKRPVVLHVGHLKQGRNIGELLKLDQSYQILVVISTLFKDTQDAELRERLLGASNVRLIDDYLPDIQEIYQLSDVYFFPVLESGNCIDVPLSCLEAAACNKPVVTTEYGEMKQFLGKEGFIFIDSFDAPRLNQLIGESLLLSDADIRESVLEYDWNRAIESLI